MNPGGCEHGSTSDSILYRPAEPASNPHCIPVQLVLLTQTEFPGNSNCVVSITSCIDSH